MKKAFRFGIVAFALSLCVGSGALALRGHRESIKTEASAGMVTMHFCDQSYNPNPKVKYYQQNSGDMSTILEESISNFSNVSPDCLYNSTISGNATTSWTITTATTSKARMIAVPVRLALNLPAQSAAYMNSFNYSLGANSTKAKIELFEASTFSGSTGIKADIATKSSTALNFYTGSGSNSFAYNKSIRFYNQTESAATKTLDYFWLVLTMPKAVNNAQYEFTFTINSQSVSDADEVVFQVNTETYSLSEFAAAKNSFAEGAVALVLKDFTLDTVLNLTKQITINLNNHVVTCTVNNALTITTNVTLTSSPAGGKLTTSLGVLVNVQGGSLTVAGSGQTLENTSTSNGKYVIAVTQGSSVITLEGATIIKGGQYGIYGGMQNSTAVGGTVTFQGQGLYGINCIDSSAIYVYDHANVGKICMPSAVGNSLILENRNSTLSYVNTAVDLEIYYPTTLSSQKTIAQCVYNQDVADHIIFKSIGSGYMSRYIDSGHYIECAYFATTPTFVLTHCSVNDPDIVLHYNTGSSMYFTAERGYDLPSTISVSNVASNMRTWYPNTGYLNIQSGAVTQSVTITVTATINTEGKALQFIASNMHMSDYTTEKGWCKDNTHNYYSIAKTAFNSLEKATRKFIMEDDTSDIVAAKERLIAWAAANGEEIIYESGSSDYVIHQASRYVAPYNNPAENSAVWIIAAVVIASSLAMAGLLIMKTRKHH